MIDPTLIRCAKDCDLLALTERYTRLVRVASTGGGEYAGPCPVPGCPSDDDGFRVQPALHRWLCRQCTDSRWQDAITLQCRVTGQSFVEAVHALTGEIPCPLTTLPIGSAACSSCSTPPTAWQARARAVIERAADDLWSPTGDRARDWLHARGLLDVTLRRWHIGYIQADRHEAAWRWGLPTGKAVYLPCGILIPGAVQENVYYLKIRKLAGRPKYTQVRGSRAALYMAETLQSGLACMTEGELDALLLWQCLQQAAEPRWRAAGVVTAGSQSARLEADQWRQYLSNLDRLLILFDQDGKSDLGAARWAQVAASAQIVHWPNLRPGDKDITDYYLAGGDLLTLVSGAIGQGAASEVLQVSTHLQNA